MKPAAWINMVRKLFISPAGVTILEHASITVLMMAAYAILIRRYGLEVTGIWVLMTALVNFAHVGDVWSKGLLSFMGEARGANAPQNAASYASTAIITGALGYFILIALCGGVLYVLSPYVFPAHYLDGVTATLPLLVFAYWLIASAGNFLQAFIGFGRPLIAAIQRVGGAVIFLIGIGIHASDDGLASIFQIQIIQGAAMICFGVIVYFGMIVRPLKHAIWDRRKLGELVRFGSKMLTVGFVQSAAEPIIKFMVGHFAGIAVVAVMEIANRLIQGVRGLTLSIGQIVITYFARIASQRKNPEKKMEKSAEILSIADEFCTISSLIISGSIAMFSLLFAFAPLLKWLFFNTEMARPETALFALILVALGLAWLFNAIMSAAYFLLVALRHSASLFITEVIRTGLIACFGFIMGQMFGLNGVLVGIILGFVISSLYLFQVAALLLQSSWQSLLRQITKTTKTTIIPLIWSIILIMIMIFENLISSSLGISSDMLFLTANVVGPIGAVVLILKYGQINHLFHGIIALKP